MGIATKVLDFDTKGVEFKFGDEEPTFIALSDFSEDIQLHLSLHGISQKLGDAYSGAKGDLAKAKEMFGTALAQLKNGDWRAARGEGDAKPRTTELAEAIARIKNVDIAEVNTMLQSASEEQRKELRANARVKAFIQVIRAEKAQARLDKMGAKDDLVL